MPPAVYYGVRWRAQRRAACPAPPHDPLARTSCVLLKGAVDVRGQHPAGGQSIQQPPTPVLRPPRSGALDWRGRHPAGGQHPGRGAGALHKLHGGGQRRLRRLLTPPACLVVSCFTGEDGMLGHSWPRGPTGLYSCFPPSSLLLLLPTLCKLSRIPDGSESVWLVVTVCRYSFLEVGLAENCGTAIRYSQNYKDQDSTGSQTAERARVPAPRAKQSPCRQARRGYVQTPASCHCGG
jgi:hypothetical protein